MDGCLHTVPIVEPRDGLHLQGTVRNSGRRTPEMEHLSFTGDLLGEFRGVIEGSGNGNHFPWGLHWETWERTQLGNL